MIDELTRFEKTVRKFAGVGVPLGVFSLRRDFTAASVLRLLSTWSEGSPWRVDTGLRRLPTGTTMPEETIDPGLLEQTKNQIRKLVAEIADLAESDIQPTEFYVEFLNRSVAAVAATGRRVLADGRPGRPEAAIPGRVRRDRPDGRPGQDRAARRAARVHAPGVASRRSSRRARSIEGVPQAFNPTEYCADHRPADGGQAGRRPARDPDGPDPAGGASRRARCGSSATCATWRRPT